MKNYTRKYPQFSLCGLNCGLCPRFHTDGDSRCPGCGGGDFHCKRGSCGIISCSLRHGGVEFCFECDSYPCDRYEGRDNIGDSFITYRNVLKDLDEARISGVEAYIAELNEKTDILRRLLDNYNDGRKKNFYCLAVNLLGLDDVKDVVAAAEKESNDKLLSSGDTIAVLTDMFKRKAEERGIILKLRKTERR